MMVDLDAWGYQRSGNDRPWSRPSQDAAFSYSDGDAHEEWVAGVIRNATDVSSGSRELASGIRDWPSLYHLSARRELLVRPVLDRLTGPVLELGAGTGAVTRALGETGLDVVALEGSPRRAAICAERCRDLPNVQVIADTIQGLGTPRRFASIVMVGVLEYARAFGLDADGRDPVDVMLDHVVDLLEPDGVLVLAIENQMGLKYLAGFPEDHLGSRMVGVEDRYGKDTAVTFGRRELDNRLARAGLTHQSWFYPFPDYKLPVSVLAESALDPATGFDPVPIIAPALRNDPQEPELTTFDLALSARPVVRNQLLADLANSFLVVSSQAPLPASDTIAWHFGDTDRRPEFRKTTVFERSGDEIVVRRHRFYPGTATSVAGLTQRIQDEVYRPATTWAERLDSILAQPGWSVDELDAWFARWLQALVSAAELPHDASGDAEVDGRFLDAVPRNLLVDGDQDVFIDLEWVTADPFPLAYLAFRALYTSVTTAGPAATPASGTPTDARGLIRAIAQRHGLDLDDAAVERYWSRELELQSIVYGKSAEFAVDEAMAVQVRRRHDLDATMAEVAAARGHDAVIRGLEDRLVDAGATEALLREEIERRGVEMEARSALIADREDEVHRQSRAAEALRAELARLQDELSLRGAEAARLLENARELDEALAGSRQESEQWRREVAAHQQTLSWKLTRPLRRTRRVLGAVKRRVRRLSTRPARFEQAAPAPMTTPIDLSYYRLRNPDLASMSDTALAAHFAAHGALEGRRAQSALSASTFHERALDPERARVVLLFHEATRTGAPVLGWNILVELQKRHDVIAVLMSGGELLPAIRDVAAATVLLDTSRPWDHFEADLLANHLAERYAPVYAIANSSATHVLVPGLEHAGVPTVALVHEFASSMPPIGILDPFYASASEIVFPAQIVADSMREVYAPLLARTYHVIPQGQSLLPPSAAEEPDDLAGSTVATSPRPLLDGKELGLPEAQVERFLETLPRSTVLVIGAGTVMPRKGVEFFVQAAADTLRGTPDLDIAFAWVGHRPPLGTPYTDDLWQQVVRSGLDDHVTFLAPTDNLDALYARADVFLLTSRLDPLPNVTIDAAMAGVPVVAFDGASGMAEWLATDTALRDLVVPHLDVAAAAAAATRLAADEAHRAAMGKAIRSAAVATFDMVQYVARLDALGMQARASVSRAAEDVRTIERQGDFSVELFGTHEHRPSLAEAVRAYVHTSRLAAPRARARTGMLVRRPAFGFHPMAYAELAPEYDEKRDGDPYADFLRRGRPAGPWLKEVIRAGLPVGATESMRVLVHAHLHYTDMADDLLARLALNTSPYDLILTTTTEDKVAELTAACERRRPGSLRRLEVLLVPNRGRDIAPLFTAIGSRVTSEYDVVFHVHGKRTPHATAGTGDRWREFLWENLVGGRVPMLDVLLARLDSDPGLGLVSPEDPHLNDWDRNRELAEGVAQELGLATALSSHFDFPVGMMWCARVDAIRPFLDADWPLEFYPPEPVAIDGTVLHATERLLPFVVADRGFRYAKSAVDGITR